jgi:exonuclease SbcD
MHSLYRLRESDDVIFDFADLTPGWAYVALGHVHKGQALHGQTNVRYCGSLDRLDFDEQHDDHGVLFVEIGRTGLMREPEHLPIRATPFHKITVDDTEAELPNLAARFPDRETAIASVTAKPSNTATSRDEIAREIRRIFPRLYELKWAEESRPDQSAECGVYTPRADFASTVRDYLAKRLTDDLDKDLVLALANEFLRGEGET